MAECLSIKGSKGYMNQNKQVIETIQKMTARIVATSPVGYKLCLIGGFRYRLLDRSVRMSMDIDYHWEEDFAKNSDYHVKSINQVLESQFEPESAANLKAAGGGEMILKEVVRILHAQADNYLKEQQ